MVCWSCGQLPQLKAAYERAVVATAPEDPMPCFYCDRNYGAKGDRIYPIMDCLVPVPNVKGQARRNLTQP